MLGARNTATRTYNLPEIPHIIYKQHKGIAHILIQNETTCEQYINGLKQK